MRENTQNTSWTGFASVCLSVYESYTTIDFFKIMNEIRNIRRREGGKEGENEREKERDRDRESIYFIVCFIVSHAQVIIFHIHLVRNGIFPVDGLLFID